MVWCPLSPSQVENILSQNAQWHLPPALLGVSPRWSQHPQRSEPLGPRRRGRRGWGRSLPGPGITSAGPGTGYRQGPGGTLPPPHLDPQRPEVTWFLLSGRWAGGPGPPMASAGLCPREAPGLGAARSPSAPTERICQAFLSLWTCENLLCHRPRVALV